MTGRLENFGFIKELSSKLLDVIPASIIITDQKGKVLRVNKGFRNFTNKKPEDMIGRSLLDTREMKDRETAKKYRRLLTKHEPFYDYIFRHYSEQQDYWYTMSLSAMPLLNERGQLWGMLSIAQDITDLNQTQRELERANKKLSSSFISASSRLNSVEKQLKKALLSRNQFFADASHELRTPLTIIKGNLDLLKLRHNQNPVPEHMRPELFNIEQEVGRVSQLLSDITFLNQADIGPEPQHNFKDVDFKELVAGVAEEFKLFAAAKKIKMTVSLKAAFVKGDEAKLKKLVTNLISNALRYTNPGGKIAVAVLVRDSQAILKVTDTGIGIGPQDLPHIFDRFYRAAKARTRESGGSGLGLAITKEIIKSHKGTINVTSKLGKGTVFVVKLNTVK